MVEDVKRVAQEREKCRPTQLICETHHKVQGLFRESLSMVVLILEGRPLPMVVAYPEYTRDLINYFNLNAVDIAEGLKKKAALEGYDAVEAAKYLQENHYQVLEWAFAETMRVLMEEEEAGTA